MSGHACRSHDAEQALTAAAAQRYRCAPGQLVAAPGTQALIQILPRLVAALAVAIVGPTYAEHELNWRRHGHDVAVVAESRSGGRRCRGRGQSRQSDRPAVSTQALRGVAAWLLVVDEAFIDLLPASASLAGDLPDNAIVLRSFGKTYGLRRPAAGLRHRSTTPLAALRPRDELGPWAVAGPALAIGATALADDAWLQETAARLAGDARKLDALLASAGFTILGGTPLFRLASHPKAHEKVEDLARQGIHVRAFGHQPTWLRSRRRRRRGIPPALSAALQVPQKVR